MIMYVCVCVCVYVCVLCVYRMREEAACDVRDADTLDLLLRLSTTLNAEVRGWVGVDIECVLLQAGRSSMMTIECVLLL